MSAEGQTHTLDRRALLAEQLTQIEDQQVSAPVSAPAEAAPTPTENKPDRARDESGKFVKAEVVTGAAAGAGGSSPADAPTVPIAAEPPLWARPPKSWRPEYHELWNAPPSDPQKWDKVREYVHTRENEMRAGIEQSIPKIRFADEMTKAIDPYREIITGLGIEPVQAVSHLMAADKALRTLPMDQKIQYIGQIAASYGVDLSKLASGEIKQPPVPDQSVLTIQNEVNSLKAKLASQEQAWQAEIDAGAQAEIAEFAKTAEYFDDVKPVMIDLLKAGLAPDLQTAYTKAIKLNDELSGRIEAAKQAKLAAEKKETADRAAKAAKAAAVSVKTSTPGAVTATKAQDRRALLAEQFDGLGERL